MDFMELALRRESCRDFSEKPVAKEKLEAVMQAARLAPSACNSQPWSFTAVTGARTAKAVAKCLQGMGTEINFAQGGKGAYWDPAKNQT